MNRLPARAFAFLTLVAFISGILYYWMKVVMIPSSAYSVVGSPLQPWMLKLHILSAAALLFLLGVLVGDHISSRLADGTRHGRRTGKLNILTVTVMIVSGYLLQVATGEWLRSWLSPLHLATGALFVVLSITHWVATRSAARESSGDE